MATKNNNGISSGSNGTSSHDGLASLLAAARPFLRGDLAAVDAELPSLVSVLVSAGAGECYHKHGTFLDHLVDVYRVLHLWGAPDAVSRCGLYHSSYSNSYVNLAIFEPDVSRARVSAIIGDAAERLVHLFCVVPRHALMHDDLHLRYTDAELRDHLAAAEASLVKAASGNKTEKSEAWRVKLRSVVPEKGVVAPHIRTGEPVVLSRRVLAIFVLMTVADFSDQYTDYQDKLFRNEDGRLEFAGDNWGALWPGTGKPGLWMSAMSRLTAIYRLIAIDERLRRMEDCVDEADADDAGLELTIPPVFDRCSKVLDPDEQIAARDLYWEAICSDVKKGGDGDWTEIESLLRQSIGKNPFVGEPWLVLAQVLLNVGRWDEAAAAAEEGLKLALQWGSSWDKRMSWEGWVSWGRVMRDKAMDKEWPRSAWGIINLGLVKQLHKN